MHAVVRCLLPIFALASTAGATRVTSETFQDLAVGKNVILKAHAPWYAPFCVPDSRRH